MSYVHCACYIWEMAVHLAVAGDVFDGVFLCWPFSHQMSWMKSGTSLGGFPTYFCMNCLFSPML